MSSEIPTIGGQSAFSKEYVRYALGLYVQEALDQGWAENQQHVLEAELVPLFGDGPSRKYTVRYVDHKYWLPKK